jgi:hypothetical protein
MRTSSGSTPATTSGVVDPHVYVSRQGAVEVAKALGWVDDQEHQVALETIADLVGQLEEANAEIENRDRIIAAYETVNSRVPAAA